MKRFLKAILGDIVHVTEAYTNKPMNSGTLLFGMSGFYIHQSGNIDINKIVEIRMRDGERAEIYIETRASKRFLEEGEGKIQ